MDYLKNYFKNRRMLEFGRSLEASLPHMSGTHVIVFWVLLICVTQLPLGCVANGGKLVLLRSHHQPLVHRMT